MEPQEIIAPFTLKYVGNDADHHILDAREYGKSVIGAANIYNAVAYYLDTGNVPKRNYTKTYACYAKVPRSGSLETVFVVLAVAQQHSLFSGIVEESYRYIFSA